MKTFRISYTLVGGEQEIAVEAYLAAEAMDAREAVRQVADLCAPGAAPATQALFRAVLLRENFSFLPGGTRAVKAVRWEELPPIVITLSDGLIENIAGIPAGYRIEVRDWDAAEVDEDGGAVPETTVWDSDGQWAPGN